MKVLVLGGGVAGMAGALLLRRAGHDVILVDRDPAGSATDADVVFAGGRATVPQFRQPHDFLGLGRRILRDRFPDVYADLVGLGIGECEPGLDVRSAKATGLVADGGRVTGVALEEIREDGDLVVDAMGRNTHLPVWLRAAGLPSPPSSGSECGLVYFSRHFRIRAGAEMPAFTTLLAGPRGDTGFLAYSTFVGDGQTFCTCIMPAASDRAFRALRDADAFMRVAGLLPGLDRWIDPDVSEPITHVLSMGAISNVVRSYVADGVAVAPGVLAIGDALVHTNPTSAFGASQSLEHAVILADVLEDGHDPTAIQEDFHRRTRRSAESRFDSVSVEDRDRLRLYGGEALDVADPRVSVSMFLRLTLPRVAPLDAAFLRAMLRRIDMLDLPDVLASDLDLLDHGREVYLASRDALPPIPQPSRNNCSRRSMADQVGHDVRSTRHPGPRSTRSARARGESRTPTPFRAPDPKSGASAVPPLSRRLKR
jgi:2-polyprenyl-6-methoxyphenol hydroxylase-like FAD-dependent oxidoreductase